MNHEMTRSMLIAAVAVAVALPVTATACQFGGSGDTSERDTTTTAPATDTRKRLLLVGEELNFAPGVVDRDETFTCVNRGIRVKAVVPPAGRSNVSHADGHLSSAEIRVTTRGDGSVLAECS